MPSNAQPGKEKAHYLAALRYLKGYTGGSEMGLRMEGPTRDRFFGRLFLWYISQDFKEVEPLDVTCEMSRRLSCLLVQSFGGYCTLDLIYPWGSWFRSEETLSRCCRKEIETWKHACETKCLSQTQESTHKCFMSRTPQNNVLRFLKQWEPMFPLLLGSSAGSVNENGPRGSGSRVFCWWNSSRRIPSGSQSY